MAANSKIHNENRSECGPVYLYSHVHAKIWSYVCLRFGTSVSWYLMLYFTALSCVTTCSVVSDCQLLRITSIVIQSIIDVIIIIIIIICSSENFLCIKPLGAELSMSVVRERLDAVGRTLTSGQWSIVERALSNCSLPLYVRLVSEDVCRWSSYQPESDTVLQQTVDDIINTLFDRLELYHGKVCPQQECLSVSVSVSLIVCLSCLSFACSLAHKHFANHILTTFSDHMFYTFLFCTTVRFYYKINKLELLSVRSRTRFTSEI